MSDFSRNLERGEEGRHLRNKNSSHNEILYLAEPLFNDSPLPPFSLFLSPSLTYTQDVRFSLRACLEPVGQRPSILDGRGLGRGLRADGDAGRHLSASPDQPPALQSLSVIPFPKCDPRNWSGQRDPTHGEALTTWAGSLSTQPLVLEAEAGRSDSLLKT